VPDDDRLSRGEPVWVAKREAVAPVATHDQVNSDEVLTHPSLVELSSLCILLSRCYRDAIQRFPRTLCFRSSSGVCEASEQSRARPRAEVD